MDSFEKSEIARKLKWNRELFLVSKELEPNFHKSLELAEKEAEKYPTSFLWCILLKYYLGTSLDKERNWYYEIIWHPRKLGEGYWKTFNL